MSNPVPEPWTWLIEARFRARKQPAEVAREVGISSNYYCEIEAGRRRLWRNIKLLGAIADAVGVDIFELDRNRPPARPGQLRRRNAPTQDVAA